MIRPFSSFPHLVSSFPHLISSLVSSLLISSHLISSHLISSHLISVNPISPIEHFSHHHVENFYQKKKNSQLSYSLSLTLIILIKIVIVIFTINVSSNIFLLMLTSPMNWFIKIRQMIRRLSTSKTEEHLSGCPHAVHQSSCLIELLFQAVLHLPQGQEW